MSFLRLPRDSLRELLAVGTRPKRAYCWMSCSALCILFATGNVVNADFAMLFRLQKLCIRPSPRLFGPQKMLRGSA
jgi:hypothetical protein